MSQLTPQNLIDNNQALVNRDILPSLIRQMEAINPVLSQFTRTALDPQNTEHVKAYLNTASEVFPIEALASMFDDNIAKEQAPAAANRPADFAVPMNVTPDAEKEQANTQDLDNSYDMGRGR